VPHRSFQYTSNGLFPLLQRITHLIRYTMPHMELHGGHCTVTGRLFPCRPTSEGKKNGCLTKLQLDTTLKRLRLTLSCTRESQSPRQVQMTACEIPLPFKAIRTSPCFGTYTSLPGRISSYGEQRSDDALSRDHSFRCQQLSSKRRALANLQLSTISSSNSK
jgi:hypothetical protein